jgi:Domain of unknown function (DUF6268)
MCNFYRVHAAKRAAQCCVVIVAMFAGTLCHAAADVCSDPGDASFASVDFANHDSSPIDGVEADTNQEERDFDLLLAAAGKRWLFGASHRYTIFDFSGIEPQTNAHVHTFFIPLHWQFPGDGRTVRVSVAPALSASSNVMSHPQQYEGATLQFLFAWAMQTRFSDRLSFNWGICGDHRFGEYEVYPIAGIAWRLHPAWELELGFPVTQLRYDVTEEVSSTLQLAPDGNEWHVMDSEFENESRLVYESVALDWVTSWRLGPHLTLAVSVGRQFRNRYELTLQDNNRVHLSSAAANRFGAGIRWSF